MNLTVERATRLGCSEEIAASIPSLAPSFEKCAEIRRAARARRRLSSLSCRAGCLQDRGALNEVGEGVLRYLSSASEAQVNAVKTKLGASTIRFSVDGVIHER